MKNTFDRKFLVIGIIGLFILTMIHPAAAILNNKIRVNEDSTKSATSYTYTIKETYIFGIIENQTDAQYNLVLSRPRPDSNYSFGIYRDISVKGNVRELHIWLFPFLVNYFKIFHNSVFDIYNRNVTLEIPLLFRANIYDFHNPDSFWFAGRAIGVKLTIE